MSCPGPATGYLHITDPEKYLPYRLDFLKNCATKFLKTKQLLEV